MPVIPGALCVADRKLFRTKDAARRKRKRSVARVGLRIGEGNGMGNNARTRRRKRRFGLSRPPARPHEDSAVF